MFVTFLSTPSARRATTYDVICQCFSQISIHALREEGDYEVYSSAAADMIFLSTPSARRATFAWARAAKKRERFLSTPSARRATSGRCPRLRQDRYFYPRPPRGGRHASRRHRQHRANFYPRPPRGGRRDFYVQGVDLTEFLSTPSARRATSSAFFMPQNHRFLSTPSARRATGDASGVQRAPVISIHALREEGDQQAAPVVSTADKFLSTPSARRATYECFKRRIKPNVFLSTPSARRATGSEQTPWRQHDNFYPRPPRGGRQNCARPPCRLFRYFYPRPPRGGRLRAA